MPHQKRRKDVRNVAIIAHVDHGKTTLVDALLKETGTYEFKDGEDTIMDSNPIERERGITIFSKNASILYKDVTINIVDTPGHADFGSEVERIIKMVDGVLLVVDAFDGPMPQTKFVLRKSLELHLKPILVINKVDRTNARPDEVASMTFDLFCELNATDEQLDFPIIYASARDKWAVNNLDEPRKDMKALLETILHRVLPPVADPEMPFQMLVTMLDYDNYVGRIAIGRIFHGKISMGETVALIKRDGKIDKGKITKILKYTGLKRVPASSASAGDIVSIAGLDNVRVSDTITHPDHPNPLPLIKIDEPTISMNFCHNTSPLSGKDGGRFLTSRHIRERLEHEAMMNIGIRVEEVDGGERFKVSGRGELHLSILIETMRREGYELEVSQPKVIFKEIDGEKYEPVEEVVIEVDKEYQGEIMRSLGARRAEIKDIKITSVGTIRIESIVASRALIGFRTEMLMMTRGTGIMCQVFSQYQKYKGEMPGRTVGVLVSQSQGEAVAYALWGLQDRGEIFIKPGDGIYEGMLIGVNNKGSDLVINPMREKKLTNMRASGSDDAMQLIPPREMTLEFALEFIDEDELVEVTPKNIRLRKRHLTENQRKIMFNKNKQN
ncbi:GTP-binding protein TypA/BipA [Candidatus Omnitrophus magneticus]|uniref:Large ribosomal subunit assembly factor BipA n=1 Tax=Candidatus Omnitrophus magneticus TaxID=1609969 RepID=A0A0F0CV21_9BACT|nr:GTP-binding protein TypA/BipA [Candidatus Omnitrophus magneticus]